MGLAIVSTLASFMLFLFLFICFGNTNEHIWMLGWSAKLSANAN